MTNVPLGPGGWYYEKGYRVCITGLGAKATKPSLQGLFGEFGHIIKIETPSRGQAAYVSFKERGDAEDAVKAMDGETVDGSKLTVCKAGDRPPPSAAARRDTPANKGNDVLTTTNFEREEKRTAAYVDSSTGVDKRLAKEPKKRSRSREHGKEAAAAEIIAERREAAVAAEASAKAVPGVRRALAAAGGAGGIEQT
eukprot:CAMPEP_0204234108 /NCGR_PEP_ID=MMETSP0361-20130328/90723_1 /ASSEMBLY_ACC=CAM_ASM_000343 /TAXON_ID=268821 /ORGANISM="Scrippsiella Hangoei, Strain SHTV-5" /LENGTH=195 /DNA_ID=CAMNT_0051204931 /DNA_START=113 /DNA_END=697 /DNA_ORIENTATION=+